VGIEALLKARQAFDAVGQHLFCFLLLDIQPARIVRLIIREMKLCPLRDPVALDHIGWNHLVRSAEPVENLLGCAAFFA
jgi:hypothetical protein